MYKEPNWQRLERERERKSQELYDSQLTEPQRCRECDKVMGDEEQCQSICELCAAGVPSEELADDGVLFAHKGDPCASCGTPHDEVEPGPCRGRQ